MRIESCQLFLPWTNWLAALITDPEAFADPLIYRFPGETGGYDRSEVILAAPTALRQGDLVQGHFLAYDFEPIPDCCKRGDVLTVELQLCDEFDQIYTQKLVLTVDRTAKRRPTP